MTDDNMEGEKSVMMNEPFKSDVKCCMCVELLMGVNIILCFGILDILNLVGSVFFAIGYNTLL